MLILSNNTFDLSKRALSSLSQKKDTQGLILWASKSLTSEVLLQNYRKH